MLFDELMRMPLLIRPPGNGTGERVNDSLVSHADLMPTVLSGCGIDVPDGLHGSDISALVNEGREPVRAGLAFQFYSSNWGERPTALRGWREHCDDACKSTHFDKGCWRSLAIGTDAGAGSALDLRRPMEQ